MPPPMDLADSKEPRDRAGRATRRIGSVVGGTLLNLAALGGTVFIVLIILSVMFNITLIMFKTGSMSPTIPAGSLAVVKQIPASEIRVGDVLTVDRGTKLPVTHRVTSVEGAGDERTITMKGDANDTEDPVPYTVTEARRVLFSAPGLAHVVVWFANPWVLGSLTISTSILVTWAFWPKSERRKRHSAGRYSGDRDTTEVGLGAHAGALAILLGLGATVLPVTYAEATPGGETETVTQGQYLTLTSIGDPDEMLSMEPNVPVHWQVGVSVTPVESGDVDVAVAAAGTPDLGLVLSYQSCTVRWEAASCPGVVQYLEAPATVAISPEYRSLLTMRDTQQVWILVTATIPEPAEGRVELNVRASGVGETVTAGPGPVGTLAVTGAELKWAPFLSAMAVVAGLAVAGMAALRRKLKRT